MPCDLSKAHIGPRLAAEICRRCHTFVRPIKVHGHLQCPVCHTVIEGCCEGESVARASEVVVSSR